LGLKNAILADLKDLSFFLLLLCPESSFECFYAEKAPKTFILLDVEKAQKSFVLLEFKNLLASATPF
jgi:hypothetical protein